MDGDVGESSRFFLCLMKSEKITDVSIISVATNCTGLKCLHLNDIIQITDRSIMSIATQCSGLQRLRLSFCPQITDSSIISISNHLVVLQSLALYSCNSITNISMKAIVNSKSNCFYSGLHFLSIDECTGLSNTLCRSYKSISELRAILLSIDTIPL